ncbi:MAG: plasmid pRiA4b ORF-3 family protein [Chloroflexota bacterium]|nr:plasmid pRiA4b ORF-3 family protein [Chloroflexota bacterium]
MKHSVHRLKVKLRSVKPPVWRRIVVRSEMTLEELSPVLEAAMGWYGGHLHVFDIGGTYYGRPDPEWGNDDLDEGKFRVRDVLTDVGSKSKWDYDFGDGWEHDIVVEEIGSAEPDVEYPICLTGRRACPPEDCGGPWGYSNLLDALADPAHPDHEELSEWMSRGFDPAHFDLEETNAAMRSPRPLEGW